MKRYLIILWVVVSIVITGCSKKEQRKQSSDRPVVIATTYAVYDILKHIGGQDIQASMLIPPGREIHSFEPSPQDIIKLNDATLVLYNGEGLEPWIGQFDIGAKALDLSKYVKLLKVEGEEHGHHHTVYDPHYWLDFDNMKKIATVIMKKLSQMEPQNKQKFQKRLQNYLKMLSLLDIKYTKTLGTCKLHTVYVNHNAYSYLAKRYAFRVKSLVGLSPDAQPNPKTVESILSEIKKEGAKAIYYEPFENNSVLFSIAKELGLQPLVLQPLGNVTAEEAKKNLGFQEIMERNLHNLSIGLECNVF